MKIQDIVFAAVVVEINPCNPSPCGPNAICNDGICTCIAEYHGDPYTGCRPECILNNDCFRDKACSRNKCINPCPGTCGQNAQCDVVNHIPMCSCPAGLTGNAFVECRAIPGKIQHSSILYYQILTYKFLQHKLLQTLANLRLVGQTVNVEKSTTKLFALVYQDLSVAHQHVALNV